MRKAALFLLWVALLAGAFAADPWVYENVSGPVAERTGLKPWRFERPPGGRSTGLAEILDLFKRLGHAFAVVLLSVTMLLIAPHRRGQVVVLWLAVALAAALGEGVLKPSVAKLRPDGLLTAEAAARVVAEHGEDKVVRRGAEVRNRGHAVFRGAFSGYREGGGLTFPSGHATLAFACFACLAAFFPRARWWFLTLAAGAAASRVLAGDHFLSDVIGGAGLGYACARTVLAHPRARLVLGAPTGPSS